MFCNSYVKQSRPDFFFVCGHFAVFNIQIGIGIKIQRKYIYFFLYKPDLPENFPLSLPSQFDRPCKFPALCRDQILCPEGWKLGLNHTGTLLNDAGACLGTMVASKTEQYNSVHLYLESAKFDIYKEKQMREVVPTQKESCSLQRPPLAPRSRPLRDPAAPFELEFSAHPSVTP